VSKQWKPGKKTVELQPSARPSRIRRDPVPLSTAVDAAKKLQWFESDRETWIVAIGVVLFALALTALTVGFGAITSWGDAGTAEQSGMTGVGGSRGAN
jgi:hypothetical protein